VISAIIIIAAVAAIAGGIHVLRALIEELVGEDWEYHDSPQPDANVTSNRIDEV
jgi:hypothetical protein